MKPSRSSDLVLRPGTNLYAVLDSQVKQKDMLFLVGLPGVGKSLMLQQAALLAQLHGRRVSLLRWDVARLAFERASAAERYPETNSATHPAIRIAIGEWLRPAILEWHRQRGSIDLLIGECPFVGNRFIELARREDDALEPLLASESASFLIPAPTLAVRAGIEAAREQEMRQPRHTQEVYNAPPNLLHELMDEIHDLARGLKLPNNSEARGYVPQTYLSVYQHLLRFRTGGPLIIDDVLPVPESAQALPESLNELVPGETEVETCLDAVNQLSEQEMRRRVSNWWQV